MTDKQITVNDVDVSKCKYYKEYSDPNEDGDEYNDICECSITESAFCFDECNSNCYFKNWQRKEQECESLGQAYLETNELFQEKTKECTNLKAENEELKKCYKNNSALLDFEETNTTKLVNRVMELEQTLIEIEKLSIQGDVYCIDYNVNDCEKCIKQSDCKTTLFKQILQKINEVENDK